MSVTATAHDAHRGDGGSGMADEKPGHIDILIPLWGVRAVDMFLSHGMLTLFANGNLPALVDRANVTFVFLTSEADRGRIEAHAAHGRLSALCKVAFVSIDDLIAPGVYGMTITLAFARGLLRRGQDMTNYAFILLMGDFVFAENSLKSVYEALGNNASAVFAPSYRATAEHVSDYVTAQIQAHDGVLDSRNLASAIIDNLHLTVRAQFVGDTFCHVEHVNQFYWRKNPDTVLSHQFLMHLFAIRPERPLTKLNYFFDYGLFDDVCPSGRYAVIDDSDRCLVLEMQSSTSELGQIQWGAMDSQALDESLSSWTCRIHRALATHPLVLHRAELKQPIGELGTDSKRFVTTVLGRVQEQMPAANHPYWRGALAAWHRHREGDAEHPLAEFGIDDRPVDRKQPQVLLAAAVGLSRLLVGERPRVTILHPQWAEFRALRREMQRLIEISGGTLAIATFNAEVFNRYHVRDAACSVMELDQLAALPAASQSAIIVDVPWSAISDLPAYMDSAYSKLRSGGTLLLSVRDAFGELLPSSKHSIAIFQALQRHPWDQIEVHAIGGPWRRISMALLAASLRSMISEKLAVQIKGVLRLGMISCLFAASNLARIIMGAGPPLIGHETMVLCRLRRRAVQTSTGSVSEPRTIPDKR